MAQGGGARRPTRIVAAGFKVTSRRMAALAVPIVLTLAWAAPAQEVTNEMIVTSGDAVPGRTGETFGGFSSPIVLDDGAVVFIANWSNAEFSNIGGLFTIPSGGALTELAILEQIFPLITNLDGSPSTFSFPIPRAVFAVRPDNGSTIFDVLVRTDRSDADSRDIHILEQSQDGTRRILDSALAFTDLVINDTGTSLYFRTLRDLDTRVLFGELVLGGSVIDLGGAMGLGGATFAGIRPLAVSTSGDGFFAADLSGAGVDTTNDESFWRTVAGVPTLIVREGEPALGLTGFTLTAVDDIDGSPFATRHDEVPGIRADGTFVFSGTATAADGSVVQGIWRGTGAGDRALVFATSSDPSRIPNGVATGAEIDDIKAVVLSTSGEIFFTAGAASLIDAPGLFGLAENGTLRTLSGDNVAALAGAGFVFSDITDLSISAEGRLAFLAELTNSSATFVPAPRVTSLWAVDANGNLRLVVTTGETVDGIELITLIRDRESLNFLGGGGATDCNAAGQIVYVAGFRGGGFDLSGVLILADLGDLQPITDFVWTGDCGSRNWHDPCAAANWVDATDETNIATTPPGTDAAQTATIVNARVVIEDEPVTLRSITATGSLTVLTALALEADSRIESLTLDGDLRTNRRTEIFGQSTWTSGTISEDFDPDLDQQSRILVNTGVLRFAGGGDHILRTMLFNAGTVIHEESATIRIQYGGRIANDATYRLSGNLRDNALLIGNVFDNSGHLILERTTINQSGAFNTFGIRLFNIISDVTVSDVTVAVGANGRFPPRIQSRSPWVAIV